MTAAIQLSFEAAGLDPHELAQLTSPDRGRLYTDLGLDVLQRQAAEQAVRLVLAERYRRAA